MATEFLINSREVSSVLVDFFNAAAYSRLTFTLGSDARLEKFQFLSLLLTIKSGSVGFRSDRVRIETLVLGYIDAIGSLFF